MAKSTSFSLCFLSNVCFSTASIIYINDSKLSPLITGDKAHYIIGSILVTISPILSSSLIFLRRFAPESSIHNLKLSSFEILLLNPFYEFLLSLGFGLCAMDLAATSSVLRWKHLYVIFLISLHYAISSHLIGIRSAVKASVFSCALMIPVAFDFGKATQSILPNFVAFGCLAVVSGLVNHWRIDEDREIAMVKEVVN